MFQGVMPYVVEGEIIDVQPTRDGERNITRYVCRAWMPDGSNIILRDVVEASPFGGISDYVRRRSRATKDNNGKVPSDFGVESLDATVGERIYIAFVGGNLTRPVIIGYCQHPNQTIELEKPSTLEPQMVMQYLGIRIEVDEKGQLRFIHKGAPKVEYKPQGGAGGALGAAAAALGAAAGATSESAIGGNDNPAITPKKDTEVTLWEMLEGGIFRLRDEEGQIIEIDRTKKRIYISNNDIKSTQSVGGEGVIGNQLATNSTDAEYLLFDKAKKLVLINARKIAQVYSFDKRKDVTDGAHTHKVGKNSEWTIGGDEIVKIDGDQVNTISGDKSDKIGGDESSKIRGNKALDISKDLEIKTGGGIAEKIGKGVEKKVAQDYKIDASGAKLSLGKGKVAIGAGPTELVDQLIQALDAFIQAAPALVSTAVGPGVFNPAAVASLTKIKLALTAIKGSL